MLTRRRLAEQAIMISAGLALAPKAAAFARSGPTVEIKRKGSKVVVPENFIGLGYEMSSVATIGLLSETNHRYVELIRGLGPSGVIRVGGIVADYTRYVSHGTAMADCKDTVITDSILRQFASFLDEIGWTAIWSVNFAQGSIEEAVAEARAVASTLGPRLLALEIGNEVENYSRGKAPFRKSPYDYETYRSQYSEWRASILNAVPGVNFAGPDTANSVEWVERMAADAHDDVQLLTTHYYRNGQTRGSAEQLLTPDPRLTDLLERARAASKKSGIPWRICEANSFSGGGKPGVSDTFIGALWTLDFMLLLASYGCAGVNIETGINQLGFVSSYSPIQDDRKGTNSAGVPYYGMLAFATSLAGCHEMLPLDFDAQGVNLTAYALGREGRPTSFVAVNRDTLQDAHISIANLGLGAASALWMTAPSPDSRTGVTFGGAAVRPDGSWTATTRQMIRNGYLTVPKMSAVVLRSEGSSLQT